MGNPVTEIDGDGASENRECPSWLPAWCGSASADGDQALVGGKALSRIVLALLSNTCNVWIWGVSSKLFPPFLIVVCPKELEWSSW